ncbi:MAG: hypothetical protein JO323_13545 [Acidobacteriia bacterium]|nr:hypothetical protein [Terriglobia bacterium]
MHPLHANAWQELLFVFFDLDRFEVFSFENLAAIETFHVVHAIAPGDDLRAVMITGDWHKTALY